jgi:hypothetical protein
LIVTDSSISIKFWAEQSPTMRFSNTRFFLQKSKLTCLSKHVYLILYKSFYNFLKVKSSITNMNNFMDTIFKL